jgi:uncharacterized membrane protein YphA (DoxX/SURF4 family)
MDPTGNHIKNQYHPLTLLIAVVWLVNGLFCKLLNFVPRHTEIVGQIVNKEYAREITIGIGLLEVLMAVWIISGIKSRFNAIVQIVIILVMNVIEQIVVPDLLLWGKLNFIFSLLFAMLIYYREFIQKKKITVAHGV